MPQWNKLQLARSRAVRYGTPPLLVLAAVLLKLYVVRPPGTLGFIIAVLLSAWYGGLGPGLLATVLAATTNGWILAPQHSPNTLAENALAMILFVVLSLPIKRIYDGHKQTAEQVQALTLGLAERDRQLGVTGENLRNETRKLKAILNSMGEGVVVADRSGKFMVFNPAAEEILGMGPQRCAIEAWPQQYGLYSPDRVTPFPSRELPLARALRGEAADDVEVFARRAGADSGKWLNVTARPLRDERGESTGAVAIFRDISSTKLAEDAQMQAKEAAESANQAKSEFLSRMSHELRTPLNSILGFAQILELAELPAGQRDSVGYILKGGRHLLGLINEVLDIARIEAGRLSISLEPVKVGDAVEQALDLVRPLAENRNVTVNFAGTDCGQQHVLADRQRLAQVLLNLLSNAVKYNRAGGAVSLLCELLTNDRFRIKVIDTGQGIAPDGLEKLFSPFERLSAEESGVEGTGLGLALSKRLVEAMGGSIGVESTPGQGSMFWVDLAAAEHPVEKSESQIDANLNALGRQTSGNEYTVIYIEDNLSNLRLMEHIIATRPEIKLIAAGHGQLGLDLIQERHPDLVLLDLHLPDMQGDVVLKKLQQDPRTRSIPVVMVSADATSRQIERLLAAGAADYLTKPLDVRELLRLLDRILQHRGEIAEMPTRTPLGPESLSYAKRDYSE